MQLPNSYQCCDKYIKTIFKKFFHTASYLPLIRGMIIAPFINSEDSSYLPSTLQKTGSSRLEVNDCLDQDIADELNSQLIRATNLEEISKKVGINDLLTCPNRFYLEEIIINLNYVDFLNTYNRFKTFQDQRAFQIFIKFSREMLREIFFLNKMQTVCHIFIRNKVILFVLLNVNEYIF